MLEYGENKHEYVEGKVCIQHGLAYEHEMQDTGLKDKEVMLYIQGGYLPCIAELYFFRFPFSSLKLNNNAKNIHKQ